MSAREVDLGYAPVLALRVTYLGELATSCTSRRSMRCISTSGCGPPVSVTGSPTWATARSTASGSKSITWSGARHHAGLQPVRAGWGSACVRKGDFLARAALAEVKARGPKQRLTWFTVRGANLFGGEIVLAGERVLGRVTAALRYTSAATCCARICRRTSPSIPSTPSKRWANDFRGTHTPPLYDPDRKPSWPDDPCMTSVDASSPPDAKAGHAAHFYLAAELYDGSEERMARRMALRRFAFEVAECRRFPDVPRRHDLVLVIRGGRRICARSTTSAAIAARSSVARIRTASRDRMSYHS